MNKKEDLYRGEILINTVPNPAGYEKHVYIKETFVKDGVLHIDPEGACLAIKYDLKKIDNFISAGIVTPEDGEKLKEDIVSAERQRIAFLDWKKQNPSATEAEETDAFQEITGAGTPSDKKRQHDLDFLLAIRRLIAQGAPVNPCVIDELPKLFKSIKNEDCFAITKPIMDRIYHLPTLLDKSEAVHISGDLWEVRSSLDNRGTGQIGLLHNFNAKSIDEAKDYLDHYRIWMREEGLKVLAAYWKTACEERFFQFSTSLANVMKQAAEETREAFFSVKEKSHFWAATRKLENTKLTIELSLPKKGKKHQKIVIEHRLVDVGARTHNISEDPYPNDIMVKVLNPVDFQQLSQIGTAIHNNTLAVHPKDILLALTLQARKAQTMKQNTNTFDEDFLFDRANLGKTAKTNKSKARSDLNKKLKKLEEKQIIEGSITSGTRHKKLTINHQPQKKTT